MFGRFIIHIRTICSRKINILNVRKLIKSKKQKTYSINNISCISRYITSYPHPYPLPTAPPTSIDFITCFSNNISISLLNIKQHQKNNFIRQVKKSISIVIFHTIISSPLPPFHPTVCSWDNKIFRLLIKYSKTKKKYYFFYKKYFLPPSTHIMHFFQKSYGVQ